MDKLRFISPDNPDINYMGRIDFTDKTSPLLIYAGSNLRFRFTGSKLILSLRNIMLSDCIITLGCIIDGKELRLEIKEYSKEFKMEIPVESNKTEHSAIIFKRNDGTNYLHFNGFYIEENAEILPQPPLPSRKIEAYGDSVCAGSWCELYENIGKLDLEPYRAEYDNAWHGFPMIAARLLNAQIHNNSQGGMAVISGTGWNFAPYFDAFDKTYTRLRNSPLLETSEWDFSLYTPHVVILAFGQNDNHKDGCPDFDIKDPEYRSMWKKKYSDIIKDLMLKYPKAHFIMTLTLMMHDPERETAVDEIVEEMKSERLHRLRFKRSGIAAIGHPRIPEQCEMAVELTEYINSLGEEIWAD